MNSDMRSRADGSDLDWSETDRRAVDLIRVLAMVHPSVGVEAGITLGWREYMGSAGASVGLEHCGASADYKKLYAEFGIAAERAARAAHSSLATVTAAGGRK